MKAMKWILILGVAFSVILGAAGCSDDDDKDPLIGTWRAQSYNGQTLPAGTTGTLALRSNGTFTYETRVNGAVVDSDTGTWSVADGVFTTTTQSDGQTDREPFTLSGRTLTIGRPGDILVLTR